MISDIPKTADIVVIGGGVMGASTAYHLAAAGAGNVVLLEKEPYFGQGATGRCAGGVRYQFATEINVQLSIASLAMLDSFEQVTGQDPLYRKCGYLFVLTQEAMVAKFKTNVAMQNRLGIETQWLDAEDVKSHLPKMHFEDALAGTFHSADGLADPNSVVMGYIQRARQLGVTAITGASVLDIDTEGNQIQRVVTNSGSIATQVIVDAAGPWAGLIGRMVGLEFPITPIRRQMLTTTPLPDLPAEFPFVIDFAQSLYFHREGTGVLTGMSNPDEKPGFDQSIDGEWELVAMQAAAERMPMLETAGRQTGWAGLYEVTPDAHPIFGETPIDGFYLVGGFSGHGFMHGPIAGKLITERILEGKSHTVDVSSLDLARFDENRLIFEYNVV
ncbi:MAG: FAD-dependent oxidoreductase [Chloroflexota bacterium]|nr:FAD-dependent oxidoreductase [Chloroflexota bacterium]